MKKFIFLMASMLLTFVPTMAQHALCFRSTNGNYWKMSTVQVSNTVVGQPQLVIRSNAPRQTFKGWGTCFNELPYDAYNLMSEADRLLFVKRLFNPYGDLRLTVGRIPVGASDYARDWYSCDELDDANSTDFNMEHFTIARDLKAVIPSIKLAQAENPNMTFWASPWSPPTWMKTNHHYAQRKTSTNGCPFNVPPFFNDQFIAQPDYYKAYCLYFSKFINAYQKQGIPITGLAYQNEAYSNTPYPGCSWKAETTGKFHAEYLGPYMAEHHPDVKLMMGTMNTSSLDIYEQIVNTPGFSKYVKQMGMQWEGANVLPEMNYRHPDYEKVLTEVECGSGTFDWNAAGHTFQLLNHNLANEITTVSYWNAILKDKGMSTWGWLQNALVQVNSADGKPFYTPEYYAYKHYSHFITPGTQILTVDEKNLVISARTPEGAIIVVMGNLESNAKTLTMDVDGQYLTATLPAKSFSTYIVGSENVQMPLLQSEVKGLATVERTQLSTAQIVLLDKLTTSADYDALTAGLTSVIGDDTTTQTHSALTNADFISGSTDWTVANVANGGDFRSTTIAGRSCWNNWSNNFTSMDIHQDLNGLEPGAYTVSCVSMCGPGEITDQHVYVSTKGDTAASAAKKVAIWNTTEGWEVQKTSKIIVGTDGRLRVGYASTSGGGSKGWFCVTGFQLTKVDMEEGDTIPTYVATLDYTVLDEALKEADPYIAVNTDLAVICTYVNEMRGTIVNQSALDDLTRLVEQAIRHARISCVKVGDDISFVIQNAGAEAETGWQLSLTNGDARIKKGLHYSGNVANTYFDSYHATKGNLWYTGHQTLRGIPNGTYRLIAKARTDGEGVYLTAQTTSSLLKTEVIVHGDTGSSLGNGWDEYMIDDITVSDSILTIGFTNDYYLTGKKFAGTWLSFDDFQLIYLSTDIPTGIMSPVCEGNIQGGHGCIVGTTSQPLHIYDFNGILMNSTTPLSAGIYVVKVGSHTQKVLVR